MVRFMTGCLLAVLVPAAPALALELACDGIDDDLDGQVDEDFDIDGDGVARCCDASRPFFLARSGISLENVETFQWNGVGFDRGITPVGTRSGGIAAGLIPPADFDGDGVLDVIWREGSTYHASVCQTEWQEVWVGTFDELGGSYVTAGDTNSDGCADLMGMDMGGNSFAATHGPSGLNPDLGLGLGATALGNCDFTFDELYGTWTPDVSLGQWVVARSQALADHTCDGIPDFIHHDLANGGAADTVAWLHVGQGDGTFATLPNSSFTIPQPHNSGDVGDLNGDGCPDWIGGGDDDGDRGSIWVQTLDCTGAPINNGEALDTCDPDTACTSFSTVPGSGTTVLFDWDGDLDQDLLTAFNNGAAQYEVDIVLALNDGTGTFGAPVVMVSGIHGSYVVGPASQAVQSDLNGNGIPDVCESCLSPTDSDGDGVPDDCDLCPLGDDSIDDDADGVANACDLCPNDADPAQADSDGDGEGDVCDPCPNDAVHVDADGDGSLACEDCDDNDPTLTGFDNDGDGVPGCAGDCNDLDPNVVPGAPEVADGIDQDCDGTVDEGTEWYDDDGDGFAEAGGDCDDGNAAIHPAMLETCDSIDEDCDGRIDNGTICADDDSDGLCEGPTCTDGSAPGDCNDGDPNVSPWQSEIPGNGIDDDCDGLIDPGSFDNDGDGFSAASGDCDDSDPNRYPGAPELVDGLDNDCDGRVDDGTNVSDDDGDGYSEANGDCDDSDPMINPGAPESFNGRDDNCDGIIDEGGPHTDGDGDGWTPFQGDCDDTNSTIHPAAEEVPNGFDDDCDGVVDPVDQDGDGWTVAEGDCNDTSGFINPAMTEVCDLLDNDCDGLTDEQCTDLNPVPTELPSGCGCASTPSPSGGLLAWLGLLLVWRRSSPRLRS